MSGLKVIKIWIENLHKSVTEVKSKVEIVSTTIPLLYKRTKDHWKTNDI